MTFLNYQQLTKSGLYYSMDTSLIDDQNTEVELDLVHVDVETGEFRDIAFYVNGNDTADVGSNTLTYLTEAPDCVYKPVEVPIVGESDVDQALAAVTLVVDAEGPSDEGTFGTVHWDTPPLQQVGATSPPLVKVVPTLARVL